MKEKQNKAEHSFTNCDFTGVRWDAKSMDVIETVAKGLVNLTELFKSQHIKIECLVKIPGCEIGKQ